MFNRVLVANRGEIALRIIRACHEMGVEALAVYSDVDADAPFVKRADRGFPLGDPSLAKSYLNMEKIIDVALQGEAEAVHPGYGLLSENPDFAEACRQAGLVFIGPPAEAIRRMGEKAEARNLVQAQGVPIIPGTQGIVKDRDHARDQAEALGYPVLLKASAGGGGIGMRLVRRPEDLEAALEATRRMALTAFGSPDLILERYLEKPRHVEIQVACDDGKAVHLYERECSVQRRYQKLIEESPSLALTEELREEMGTAALTVARAVGYRNLGTVEFIVSQGRFYFLEMNTRLQVEHPVTEWVTGMDLVQHQIRIAAGESELPAQDEILRRGHAIECRINAEDPARNFLPSPGTISDWREPGGPWVRVDSGVEAGYTVPYQYDPLMAKLVVWGQDRRSALRRTLCALREFSVQGPKTTIPFHQAALAHPAFQSGEYDTHLAGDVSLA